MRGYPDPRWTSVDLQYALGVRRAEQDAVISLERMVEAGPAVRIFTVPKEQ